MLAFTRYTKRDYEVARPHRLICSKLDDIVEGRSKRLIIEAPPRHGKSELVSRKLPAYYLGRHPQRAIIAASYGADLATDFGRDVRNLVNTKAYANLFPGVTLSVDSQAKDHWYTNRGGYYLSAGIGSGQGTSTTGRGANLLIIDDPTKSRASAESEVFREGLKAWYRSVAYTRLEKDEAIIVMATRWHEDDMIGWLVQQELGGADKWDRLTLPAIDIVDGVEAALWPEKYPLARLKQIHTVIKDYDWNSLYMQRPRPAEGSYFTLSDMLVRNGAVPVPGELHHEFVPHGFPEGCDGVFAVIDSASKTGKTNDGTAVTYFAYAETTDGGTLWVLDWDIVQIEGAMLETWLPTVFDYLEILAGEVRARFGANAGVWIEDKSSGIILIQQAQRRSEERERDGKAPMNVKPIDSKLTSLGKSERAINASPYVNRRMVRLTRRAYDRVKSYKEETKNHWLSQVLGFRIGTRDMSADDLLDTFTYGVSLALGNAEGF